MISGAGTPTPGMPPTPGATPQATPPPQGGGQGVAGPGYLQAIIQKLASLIPGYNAMQQGNNKFIQPANNMAGGPPQMGGGPPTPGATPMPSPSPSPTPGLSEEQQLMSMRGHGLPGGAAGMPPMGMPPKPSPLTPPHLADASKRIGGNEMSGRKGGVLGIKQKNPMATAKKPAKKSSEEA